MRRMSLHLDPPRGLPSTPAPAGTLPLAQTLAELALQRQASLLGTGDGAGRGAPPGTAPPATPSGPAAVPDQLSLSAQARASLEDASPQPTTPAGALPNHTPGPASAPAAARTPGPGTTLLPSGPSTTATTPVLPPWPSTGAPAPVRALIASLVQQLTASALPQRVVAIQPWPAALVPVAEGAARGEGGLPGLPPLQTWLVRQGVVQTAEGERAFSLTLRVPVPWLQSQAQPAAASAPAPHTPSLAALFAGKPQALQSGTWALVLQSTEPAAGRTSALLALEFAPLAQAHVYGRELLQARQDPWLQMAVLQASGQAPKDEDAVREREAGLCQTPGCPYAGRASCAQPFCVALRVVQPSGSVEPMPPP